MISPSRHGFCEWHEILSSKAKKDLKLPPCCHCCECKPTSFCHWKPRRRKGKGGKTKWNASGVEDGLTKTKMLTITIFVLLVKQVNGKMKIKWTCPFDYDPLPIFTIRKQDLKKSNIALHSRLCMTFRNETMEYCGGSIFPKRWRYYGLWTLFLHDSRNSWKTAWQVLYVRNGKSF